MEHVVPAEPLTPGRSRLPEMEAIMAPLVEYITCTDSRDEREAARQPEEETCKQAMDRQPTDRGGERSGRQLSVSRTCMMREVSPPRRRRGAVEEESVQQILEEGPPAESRKGEG